MKRPLPTPASFTLVEILTATAILSILFFIMFGILQQVSVGWQAANRRVEASQAARLAFEQIAQGLENCVAVRQTNLNLPGSTTVTNIAYGGFRFFDGATNPATNWVAQGISFPNDSIFFITPSRSSLGGPGEDLEETGYAPVFVSRTSGGSPGYGNVRIGRYVLLQHRPQEDLILTYTNNGRRETRTNQVPLSDYMTNLPNAQTNWAMTPGLVYAGNVENFFPVVDNCVGFEVKFIYTNGQGTRLTNNSWGWPNTNATGDLWTGNPADPDNAGQTLSGMPLSVLLTMVVLDERSAERVYRLRANGLTIPMISNLVAAVTNPAHFERIPDDPQGIRATLRGGMISFQREVFLKNRSLP